MYIKSAEDYENYMKYMEGSIPAYTGDEIKDLCAVDVYKRQVYGLGVLRG